MDRMPLTQIFLHSRIRAKILGRF